MTLRVPPTQSNTAEWTRLAANAINSLVRDFTSLVARVVTLETFKTSATTDIAALGTRTTALETFAASPFTVPSITLTPGALPGSPVKGQTVYDVADDKVKTWNGTAWQAHF